ncbi:phosphoinositide 3-kinase regulatory subunit 6-like, partial [Plectropomus leopardus]|uniref:phosphoinositide 3-kinase regulatory subunit 6-like n=1 Tax=Plectropomus leopardus TaxID=160734 RepID=UPI001C4AE7F3
ALGEQTVEKYFQEVVAAVEMSVKLGAGGRTVYLKKLKHIYRDILSTSTEGKNSLNHSGCSAAMPPPEVNFILWTDEDVLWNVLADFACGSCSNSASIDEEDKDKRDSVRSEDSGIERDLKDFEDAVPSPVTHTAPVIRRRNAFKSMRPGDRLSLMKDKMDTFPGGSATLKEDGRRHTARVVVMGDDRVLGRLARTYHSIRERESKRLLLTKKLNLRLYYVPVSDVESSVSLPASHADSLRASQTDWYCAEDSEGLCSTGYSSPDRPRQDGGRLSLAASLGRADPWYHSNVNSLATTVSKLGEM